MERLRPSIMTVVTSPSYEKELQYRKALNELVSAMIKDIADTFSIPRVAQDAKPKTLAQTMKELRNRALVPVKLGISLWQELFSLKFSKFLIK